MENDKYIGRLLGGRYELIDVVGVGGMAVVYRARDTILGRYVAIKILKEEFAKDPDIRKRFAIESRAVAKLSHHNIVSVYDVGNEDGTDYIVMELIEGVTLKEYLQQKGRLSWQESIFFAEQISSALVHAHSRGIIHQDIKPQNVIILRDGTAKLTDFGIASFATTQETRVVQEAIGSVHYISPEQAKGSKIDYRTDIYSLGVVMYEMLTGRLPFEGETALQIVMQHINAVPPMPSELVPDIPKGLDAIVMHAMCANISRRYASADELCADLARVREDPDTQFYYTASDDSSGETQVIGREVQRAARHAAAEDTAAIPAAPRRRSEPHSARREAPARRRTSVRERESSDFFEKLSERPAMAAGMAVAVVAAISLLVVAVLMFTGSGKSAKIDVPDLIGRTIDDVYADSEVMNNFEIKEAPSRQESDRPAGEILDQDPSEGQQAIKGSVITVTVSAGGDNVKDTYKVVDFTGKSLDYVAASLDAHGIELQGRKGIQRRRRGGQGHPYRPRGRYGTGARRDADGLYQPRQGAEIRRRAEPDRHDAGGGAACAVRARPESRLGRSGRERQAGGHGRMAVDRREQLGKSGRDGQYPDLQGQKGRRAEAGQQHDRRQHRFERGRHAGQTSAHTGGRQRDHSGGAARQRGYRPCRDLCRWRHSV